MNHDDQGIKGKVVLVLPASFLPCSQHMFPQLDVTVAKLSQCQRVALFDYDESSNLISLRQYAITAEPVGISRNLRRLLLRKKVVRWKAIARNHRAIKRLVE